jgi:hypothetical protein
MRYVRPAIVQGHHLLRVDIKTGDGEAGFIEEQRQGQTDIAGPGVQWEMASSDFGAWRPFQATCGTPEIQGMTLWLAPRTNMATVQRTRFLA